MSVAERITQIFCSISSTTLYCKQIKRRRKTDTEEGEAMGACLLSTLLISLYIWSRDLGLMYSLLCCGVSSVVVSVGDVM